MLETYHLVGNEDHTSVRGGMASGECAPAVARVTAPPDHVEAFSTPQILSPNYKDLAGWPHRRFRWDPLVHICFLCIAKPQKSGFGSEAAFISPSVNAGSLGCWHIARGLGDPPTREAILALLNQAVWTKVFFPQAEWLQLRKGKTTGLVDKGKPSLMCCVR